MAEFEDTSAALGRLEAALDRIAAQVGKPRPASATGQTESLDSVAAVSAPAIVPAPAQEDTSRLEIAAKLDDLIGGLRNALGIERHS